MLVYVTRSMNNPEGSLVSCCERNLIRRLWLFVSPCLAEFAEVSLRAAAFGTNPTTPLIAHGVHVRARSLLSRIESSSLGHDG